jgi:hypothetical protein
MKCKLPFKYDVKVLPKKVKISSLLSKYFRIPFSAYFTEKADENISPTGFSILWQPGTCKAQDIKKIYKRTV